MKPNLFWIVKSSNKNIPVTDFSRGVLGFFLGLIVMTAIVSIFKVNTFDFDNMRRGVDAMVYGINPWADATRLQHFYNPPFAIVFMWPLLFVTPKVILVLGGALLSSLAFYLRAWVALSFFATNVFLWVISAGGIDMLVMGAGVILLLSSDRVKSERVSIIFRVIGYGFLLIKPQGGIFIVALFVLLRRDWKGVLAALLVYGLLFAPLFPDWFRVLFSDPPQAQNEASQSLLKKFGLIPSLGIAILVILSRRWKYWQLGGALSAILAPYGMPGVPFFLILTGVESWKAAFAVVFFSASLAWLTWVTPPPGVELYAYISPLMAIFHLSMIGIALIMACLSPAVFPKDIDTIDIFPFIKKVFAKVR